MYDSLLGSGRKTCNVGERKLTVKEFYDIGEIHRISQNNVTIVLN